MKYPLKPVVLKLFSYTTFENLLKTVDFAPESSYTYQHITIGRVSQPWHY